jgi:hypothetical protein
MTTPVQTSGYKTAPAKAYPGLLHDGMHDIGSVCCDEADGIAPGLLLVRTDGGDYAAGLPAAQAADADGIYTSHAASAGGAQNLTDADWDGVLAGTRFAMPRKLTVTLNNHANWDATTGSITFRNQDGEIVTESLTIPDAGNVTLTTSGYAIEPPSAVTIPQQAGTAATYTIGVSADVTLDGGHVLGVSVREHKGLNAPGFDDNEVWDEGAELGALRQGRIYVKMENAFSAGDMPYVRITAGVGETKGRFRSDTDSGDAIPFRRGRLLNSGSANEFGVLDVRL